MSEVQSRGSATRGRGGFRGGRGGYRGARGGKPHSKTDDHETNPPLEDQGEVGELKSKYADKLPLLREVAEGWSDEDLVFALQETNGDEAAALDRITSGTISQWGEVKKKQPRLKDATALHADSPRGRGRGGFEGRGRGRAQERGARVASAARGARSVSTAHTNGTKPVDKTVHDVVTDPVAPTNGKSTVDEATNEQAQEKIDPLPIAEPKATSVAAPAAAPAPATKGWAGLFAKPAPAPLPVHKKEPVPAPAPASAAPSTLVDTPRDTVVSQAHILRPEDTAFVTASDGLAPEIIQPPPIEPLEVEDSQSELPSAPHSDTAAGAELTPPADELTKENLNQLPDTSNPAPSATAASTVASTQDPLNPALPPVSAIRPGMSGHAASALRATAGGSRSASYSRKVLDQQEAVVMPGNHAVDRAAVQFGKMGLDSDDVDADEDREEPETRTQLPDDSPSAPRTSLPPTGHEAQPQVPMAQPLAGPPTEPAAQRQASGLPSTSQQLHEPSPHQASAYADQYAYRQGHKPYDPFSQQPNPPQTSEPFSNQLPGQSHLPAGMTQQEYAQYYNREYAQYYQQQYAQNQDVQRSGSAFGSSGPDSQAQYATAGGPRGYGSQDLGASGNNTPNPPAGHQAQQSTHMQPAPGSHPGYPQAAYAGYGGNYTSNYPQYGSYGSMRSSHQYGSNRPMFDDARRQQQEDYYSSQYGAYGHNQNYAANYKSNMYGAPQHQYSHDYSSGHGGAAFGGRDSGYGRTGSTQPSETPQSGAGSTAFGGGMPDPFGRTPSGFGQNQHGGAEDPAKPSGPSPSLPGGRPGSVNAMSGQQQAGLPQAHSTQQQAFGAYPQYNTGLGNQNQNSNYGAYGTNNAFSGYGGYGRGGWTGNYGGNTTQH